VTRAQRLTGGVLGATFLALHLPFLPPSLEDLDSVNFALGIRHYDIAQHQPHPPGYPLYIAAAKLLHATGLSEVHALSLLGVIAGGFGVFALMKLFSALDEDRLDSTATVLAVVLAAVCPLFWFTAGRPLSDMVGLAAAIVVQALLIAATGAAGILAAAFFAGLAAGIRSQVVWLTLPLLVYVVWRGRSVRLQPDGDEDGSRRPATAGRYVRIVAAYAAGALVWAVPMIIVSGGPAAYLRVFYSQGAEDLSGVAMLATTPTLRQAFTAFQFQFLGPWGEWPLGAVALGLASVGFVWAALRERRTLIVLLVAYGPYLAFDLVFQETITTRYALPLVVPIAFLAVRGVSAMPGRASLLLVVGMIAGSAYVSDQAMYGYSAMDAPAFRLLGDMQVAAQPEGAALPTTPVLAMHRREYFDFRRPFQWVGDRLPQFAQRLAAPPKHEWLEVVKYWNGGGREPVWFIADPLRSDLALFKYAHRPVFYRWPLSPKILLGGARPNEMDWHVIESPEWYLGEGWAITPETAGTAREDRKGPGYAPISGWIRRYPEPVTLMIGGRNLADNGPAAALHVTVDGASVLDDTISPGFFLRMIDLPSTSGNGPYATVTIDSDNAQLAIEQFDAQPQGRVIYGFGDGWNEQEYNPSTGVLWRWSSDRSVIRVRSGGHALALTLRGEIEEASSSTVTLKAGDTIVSTFDVGRQFSRVVMIPQNVLAAPETELTVESSAFYVPAETRWRSQDRRKLGLKLIECSLTPAS
jgi:hypothetical protein